jgi:preprotein translocase subunit SecF
VWGAGATIAAFHDVLVCLGFLAFFDFEITLNVIAALLTLVGYSVNDTIVIFDRARENMAHRRKESMAKLLNDSLNQTLTRTIISNGTTFLAVLGLFRFGGEVLRGFGFTMVVGIVVGTYSTLFIAVPLVNWWYERQERAAAPAKASA